MAITDAQAKVTLTRVVEILKCSNPLLLEDLYRTYSDAALADNDVLSAKAIATAAHARRPHII